MRSGDVTHSLKPALVICHAGSGMISPTAWGCFFMGVNVVPWQAERVFIARHVLLNISESHVWDPHIIRNLARHNFRSSRIKPNPIRFSFSECISLVSSRTCAPFFFISAWDGLRSTDIQWTFRLILVLMFDRVQVWVKYESSVKFITRKDGVWNSLRPIVPLLSELIFKRHVLLWHSYHHEEGGLRCWVLRWSTSRRTISPTPRLGLHDPKTLYSNTKGTSPPNIKIKPV